MKRFLAGILLSLILSALALAAVYPLKSGASITTPPVRVSRAEGSNYTVHNSLSLHIPAWSRVNLTCGDGTGELYVYNVFTGKVVFKAPIYGSLKASFPVPYEGTYSIDFRGNGSATCSLVVTDFHAPLKTQKRYSLIGILSSVLLSLLLWRWYG
ncbi:hypothetical protein [Thermococcus gorgonarius]|uniref:Uncharacterized protein n=1 Tax=Thermococcus gorgonarius TaxID=71997 RepID=A0A2Z2M440_THEGO|nr:hypothetical protein [Thermococcus gorgonarius]ASJ00557.1 hypothetical protein A3K92_03245 [Thermococcus gorgonarius]